MSEKSQCEIHPTTYYCTDIKFRAWGSGEKIVIGKFCSISEEVVISKDSSSAAAQALSFAQSRARFEAFADAGRRLIFRKGTDAHHYKYSAAVFEDYDRVSSEWRPHMLATAVYFLPGTSVPDSPVMERARHAVREL